MRSSSTTSAGVLHVLGLSNSVLKLPIDDEVWGVACDLARRSRDRGITVPATDIVIAACAVRHGAALESADSDFTLLATVGGPEG